MVRRREGQAVFRSEPLASTADALRHGRTDPLAHVERLLEHAETVEPRIEALVDEPDRGDRVRDAARAVATQYPYSPDRPPLYGVPVGVKDMFHVDGLPTRGGSELPPEALAGPEAAVVTALRDAGALVFGKTVTTEFAHFEPGPTRNPHDTSRTPGGSSSGSAAAVATGVCPLALGTQTIGSVIRPAAFCGIVGFKPTFGRVSTDGVITLSASVDHVGWFTQDVEGSELVASVLCDDWRTLPSPSSRPTLGVPTGPYLEQASATARDAFASHVDRLTEAGYEVVRADALSAIDSINARHERLVAADAALAHEARFREHGDRYAAATRELIDEGMDVTARAIARARRSRGELRELLADRMNQAGIDLWIAPAAPGPAPRGIDTTGDPVMNLPWTHAGLPTVTVPASRTDDGLPLGVQIAGRFGADEDVLGWAGGIDAVFPASRTGGSGA